MLLAIAVPASAHVFVVESEVVGGGYGTEITIRVPHGCDGAATTALEVQIPAGVTSVKPKLLAGWTIDVTSTAPVLPSMAPDASFTDEQMDAMNAPIVSSIKWSGGTLPDNEYADFQIDAVFPETPGHRVASRPSSTAVTPRSPGSRSRPPARIPRRWSIRRPR